MKIHELFGKTIQFNKRVNQSELDFSPGMKAVVTRYEIDDDMAVLTVDFKQFEEENKRLDPGLYFDKNGRACLKWHETNLYPKDCISRDYYMFKEVESGICEFDVL